MKLLRGIDKFLNSITMYTLLTYGLGVVLIGAVVFSVTGQLPISTAAIVSSAAVILAIGYVADHLLPIIFNAPSNKYSSLITCLILTCILPPSTSIHHLALLGLGAIIAITSKYLLARHYKHIFNPAALAALVLGLSSLLPATWWIGSPIMLPLTIVFGLLVVRKVRRFQLLFSFLVASLAVAILVGLIHDQTVGYILSTAFRSSPLIFLGTVMLTEPSTTPPRAWQQCIYGLIVGALFTSQLRLGTVSATPELALIIGNLYSYIASPKRRLKLRLKLKQEIAPNIYDFSFTGAQNFNFRPGQYLEWTLPRDSSDARGNRRIFSIASAPGESEMHLATKFSNKSSSFKKALLELNPGDSIMAGQLAGDFVLPSTWSKKLVFIAGGIGITPFVSMVRAIIKTKQKRDVVLLYLISQPSDFCYQKLWQVAGRLGVRVIPILSDKNNEAWKGRSGYLTEEILKSEVPDYAIRHYYISGPPALVDNYYKLLRSVGIGYSQIVTDHFSGY